jgi:uncharacterized protein (DUF2141 family)
MKKTFWVRFITLTAILMLAVMPVVSAHSSQSVEERSLTVLINGVKVVSDANHMIKDGKVYVSVEAFARLTGKPFELSKDRQTVQFNGKTISNILMNGGEATAWVRDMASAAGAQNVSWEGDKQQVYVLLLPGGTIQITPSIPGMGEHWANPKELPIGPIYGVEKGKLVFIEQMISQQDFTEGKNYVDIPGMKGLPSPAIVHTDIEFLANGHEGFEVPHFDIHHYFVTHEEHLKFGQGNYKH